MREPSSPDRSPLLLLASRTCPSPTTWPPFFGAGGTSSPAGGGGVPFGIGNCGANGLGPSTRRSGPSTLPWPARLPEGDRSPSHDEPQGEGGPVTAALAL